MLLRDESLLGISPAAIAVMPLFYKQHISLGVLMQNQRSDSLHIFDSVIIKKDRIALHKKAAFRLLTNGGEYDESRLAVKVEKTSKQPNSYDCGVYAILFCLEFLEKGVNAAAKIKQCQVNHLRTNLHNDMEQLMEDEKASMRRLH